MPPSQRQLTAAVWLLISVLSIFLIERAVVLLGFFGTPLLLFSLAWLISLLLQPAVVWMTRLPLPRPRLRQTTGMLATTTVHMPRALAVLLIYLLLLAGVTGVIVAFVPIVVNQIGAFAAGLPVTLDRLREWLVGTQGDLQRAGFAADLERVLRPEILLEQAGASVQRIFEGSLGIAGSIANLLFNAVLVLILSYYMTLDSPRIAERIRGIMPDAWQDEVDLFMSTVESTFGAFIRATVLQSLVYGFATALIMALLELPQAALAGVVAGIMVLIPLVGGVLALIPPALIALVQAPDSLAITLVLLIIFQQILFNVVMPRVMGQIIGLHPLLVFGAMLLGVTAAGGWGLLFAIPIAGVIASISQFIYMRARHNRSRATQQV